MYNVGKSRVVESDPLDSTRVIDMMREYHTLVGPSNQPYQTDHKPKCTSARSVLSSPNFDDSSLTEELYPSKIRKLETSPLFDSHQKSSALTSKLRRKLLESERELQHANATISNLKAIALTIEPESKMVSIEYEKKLELKNQECESLIVKLLQLTNMRQLLEEQEVSSREAYTLEKGKLKSELHKISLKFKAIQVERDDLETEIDRLKIDNSSSVKQLQNDLMKIKVELEVTNSEKQKLEEQRQDLMKQVQEKAVFDNLKVNSELEAKLADLEAQLKKREEKDKVVTAMLTDVKRLVFLEKECNHLRKENESLRNTRENTFLLKEKLSSAYEQLAIAQSESSKNSEFQLNIKDLQRRLEKWELIASSPSAASGFISQLQKRDIMNSEQIGKFKSELLSCKTSIIDLEGQVSSLKSQLKQSNQNTEIQISNIKKQGRKLLLLGKQVESNKRTINSYESEITIDYDEVNRNKVETLESLVEEYKQTIDNYESELKLALEKAKTDEKSENELLLETEVKKLNSQVKSLQNQVQGYELLKNTERNEQIFHFRSNPVASAQQRREQEMKNLKEENENLKARVQILENGNLANVTADAQQLLKAQGGITIDSLKEQLSLAEQKNKRIMEVFKKTSQDFREINYLLTGFKIDMPTSNKFKLSHLYAESSQDYLLFEQTSDGKVQLLETDYSKCVKHLINDFLVKHDSIPLFLSNITSELFYRQTTVLNA